MSKVLITGAAGFIGFHLAQALLARGDLVVGVDNLDPYYDVQLKKDRLSQLMAEKAFSFFERDIADTKKINKLFNEQEFDVVVNLAAQAGVRYSLENPLAYIDANIVGFTNILEVCRHHRVKNLVYASSSAVYGANAHNPASENDNVDHPVSLYGASKKANELMAHTYASLFGLSVTGLRFFTVYGAWGRPDMALSKFTKNILEGRPIEVYNDGDMERDFTYVDDVVQGIIKVIDNPAKTNPDWSPLKPECATSYAPYAIYNIGKGESVNLLNFIEEIEKALGEKAIKQFLPLQPGDVLKSYSDTKKLQRAFDYKPNTTLEEGLKVFIDWYRGYYKV